ncbi:MAG: isoprenyl transferase [Clostridiales Family XIII bacterium]|jgi:undecaprenyl diphosphate synthase|nr:isoprenyl transferase [Clostridiales Family XIII bacterium]
MAARQENAPVHAAIIMDGNGRWAENKGISKYFGHDAGMRAMTAIVRHASDIGIQYLTVYAFSTENWKRGAEEISGIFKLLMIYVDKELDELWRNNVKVNVVGDTSEMPKDVRKYLERTVSRTAENTGLVFNICLGYGSRAEIVRAARRLAEDALAGNLAVGAIDEKALASRLYTGDMPDPDFIIRPGGEKRLSNFLLWQAAYSEFIFSDVLWPDFTPEEFDNAIMAFSARKRRFGGRS